ncbi:TPA: hypothetical protein N0F65_012081 [Lagenidium giganteum]|uniref:FYVE-type domain-containing protein n=1 Tax=Lagenidium giganteum TaxID=4803 RepID=A0AAV2YGZ9_9STRA|nr:TPA: hypothetical protein N0F65_012081 [Lagenidium giganteum]
MATPVLVTAASTSSDDGPDKTRTLSQPQLHQSTLFKRMSAHAMGMEPDALCHRSHWVPKSTRTDCSNCKKAFRLWSAKHHCRLCGEVVCGPCSTKRILFQRKSVRTCDDCINTNVQSIAEYNRCSSAGDFAGWDSSRDSALGALTDDTATTKRDSSSSTSSGCASSPEVDGSRRRVALAKPASQPPATAAAPAPTPAPARPSPTAATSKKSDADCALYLYKSTRRSEEWRSQLPYALVLVLVTVAGVTNYLAYF